MIEMLVTCRDLAGVATLDADLRRACPDGTVRVGLVIQVVRREGVCP